MEHPNGDTGAKVHIDARVVELADSLDSGSSVHYGRAGSQGALFKIYFQRGICGK